MKEDTDDAQDALEDDEQTSTDKDAATSSQDEHESDGKQSSASAPRQLATIRQLFSFAESKTTKVYIAIAFLFAVVSGAVMPAMAFYTAQAFEKLSGSPSSDGFMGTVREVCFIFMVLGVLGDEGGGDFERSAGKIDRGAV